MPEYELLEVRRGHFAKVVDGEIVGMASEGEVFTHRLRKTGPHVEPATIEITLAVAALFAVLATFSWHLLLRLAAGFAFVVSLWAAEMFCWIYVAARVPLAWTRFYASGLTERRKALRFQAWLLLYYPQLLVKFFLGSFRGSFFVPVHESVELAYLTLFFAIGVVGVVLAFVLFIWPLVDLAISVGGYLMEAIW